MQAYFDRDDAELEFKSLFSRTASRFDGSGSVMGSAAGWNDVGRMLAALAGLGILTLAIAGYLGSDPLAKRKSATTPNFEASFMIEVPKPQILKPPPKPKPAIKKAVETKPVERIRGVPDKVTQVARPQTQLSGRVEVRDAKRLSQQEAAAQRSMAGTIAPVVAQVDENMQRDYVEEQSNRSTTRALQVNSNHEAIAEETTRLKRSTAEGGESRVKLDPYHYQMVNVCLRQCVRTMFAHTGMDEREIAGSKSWLKVTRGNDNYFEFSSGGRWVRFIVNANLLGEISNIDFVRVSGNSADLESLYEDATRKLCHLLGYDDCFAKL